MSHTIDRLEIELQTHDEAIARAVTERLSAMRVGRLEPLLVRVCDDLGAAAGTIRIDALEVSVGRISVDDLEAELTRKLEPALRAALAEAIARTNSGACDAQGPLATLEIFARSGNLPWWEAPDDLRAVARAFASAAREAPRRLVDWMVTLAGDEVAIARLAAHLDDDVLAALVPCFEASPIAVLLRATPELERALTSGGLASGSPGGGALRRGLMASIAGGPRTEDEAARIFGDEVVRRAPGVAQQILALVDLPRSLRVAFAGGATPRVATIDTPSPTSIPSKGPSSRPPPARDATRDDREGGASGGEHRAFDSRPASAPGASPPVTTSPGRAAWSSAPSRPLGAREPPEAWASPVVPPRASDLDRPGRKKLARALSRLDHVYVTSAGLVLLWPFYRRFFERIEVLDASGSGFVDGAASGIAVRALASLASADPAPPEFTLSLAKILAGWDPDDPIDLDAPLPPAILREGDVLLDAVLEQATALGAPDRARFRRTFLARRAALGTEHGTWILQVERREEDVLLDRLSWSWSWVKLPWMPHPLRVTW